jgi:dephospho-CoA kinase
VNLHVRVVGSPGWRYPLLMRDFLRAEPAALAEYAALKAGLAAAGMSRAEYTDAKEPWYEATLGQMSEWAEHTGWQPGGAAGSGGG